MPQDGLQQLKTSFDTFKQQYESSPAGKRLSQVFEHVLSDNPLTGYQALDAFLAEERARLSETEFQYLVCLQIRPVMGACVQYASDAFQQSPSKTDIARLNTWTQVFQRLLDAYATPPKADRALWWVMHTECQKAARGAMPAVPEPSWLTQLGRTVHQGMRWACQHPGQALTAVLAAQMATVGAAPVPRMRRAVDPIVVPCSSLSEVDELGSGGCPSNAARYRNLAVFWKNGSPNAAFCSDYGAQVLNGTVGFQISGDPIYCQTGFPALIQDGWAVYFCDSGMWPTLFGRLPVWCEAMCAPDGACPSICDTWDESSSCRRYCDPPGGTAPVRQYCSETVYLDGLAALKTSLNITTGENITLPEVSGIVLPGPSTPGPEATSLPAGSSTPGPEATSLLAGSPTPGPEATSLPAGSSTPGPEATSLPAGSPTPGPVVSSPAASESSAGGMVSSVLRTVTSWWNSATATPAATPMPLPSSTLAATGSASLLAGVSSDVASASPPASSGPASPVLSSSKDVPPPTGLPTSMISTQQASSPLSGASSSNGVVSSQDAVASASPPASSGPASPVLSSSKDVPPPTGLPTSMISTQQASSPLSGASSSNGAVSSQDAVASASPPASSGPVSSIQSSLREVPSPTALPTPQASSTFVPSVLASSPRPNTTVAIVPPPSTQQPGSSVGPESSLRGGASSSSPATLTPTTAVVPPSSSEYILSPTDVPLPYRNRTVTDGDGASRNGDTSGGVLSQALGGGFTFFHLLMILTGLGALVIGSWVFTAWMSRRRVRAWNKKRAPVEGVYLTVTHTGVTNVYASIYEGMGNYEETVTYYGSAKDDGYRRLERVEISEPQGLYSALMYAQMTLGGHAAPRMLAQLFGQYEASKTMPALVHSASEPETDEEHHQKAVEEAERNLRGAMREVQDKRKKIEEARQERDDSAGDSDTQEMWGNQVVHLTRQMPELLSGLQEKIERLSSLVQGSQLVQIAKKVYDGEELDTEEEGMAPSARRCGDSEGSEGSVEGQSNSSGGSSPTRRESPKQLVSVPSKESSQSPPRAKPLVPADHHLLLAQCCFEFCAAIENACRMDGDSETLVAEHLTAGLEKLHMVLDHTQLLEHEPWSELKGVWPAEKRQLGQGESLRPRGQIKSREVPKVHSEFQAFMNELKAKLAERAERLREICGAMEVSESVPAPTSADATYEAPTHAASDQDAHLYAQAGTGEALYSQTPSEPVCVSNESLRAPVTTIPVLYLEGAVVDDSRADGAPPVAESTYGTVDMRVVRVVQEEAARRRVQGQRAGARSQSRFFFGAQAGPAAGETHTEVEMNTLASARSPEARWRPPGLSSSVTET